MNSNFRKICCWCGLALAAFAVLTVISGCGSSPSPSPPPSPPSTTPAPTPPTPPPTADYSCESALHLGPVKMIQKKGLCLDDTTFSTCAGKIPLLWPNTKDRVTSLRLFAPWKEGWAEDARVAAWNDLKAYVEANDAKILLGTPITCNKTSDAQVWRWTKQLISKLGAKRIMGLGVGNEMDLLFMKGPEFQNPECMARLWNYSRPDSFLQTFLSYVKELDSLVPGFKTVPVTTVWSTYCYAQEPFVDNPKQVMCKSFFEESVRKFGTRFVFAFNIYPYFDNGNHLDPGTTDQCHNALKDKLCFDEPTCFTNAVAVQGRIKIRNLLHSMNMSDDKKYQFWIGESGWSSPVSSTTQPEMKKCPEWSANATFVKNYDGWLKWNLTLTKDTSIAPADHVFFFTMRDSLNFGETEHFGLISECKDSQCKLQKTNATVTTLTATTTAKARDDAVIA